MKIAAPISGSTKWPRCRAYEDSGVWHQLFAWTDRHRQIHRWNGRVDGAAGPRGAGDYRAAVLPGMAGRREILQLALPPGKRRRYRLALPAVRTKAAVDAEAVNPSRQLCAQQFLPADGPTPLETGSHYRRGANAVLYPGDASAGEAFRRADAAAYSGLWSGCHAGAGHGGQRSLRQGGKTCQRLWAQRAAQRRQRLDHLALDDEQSLREGRCAGEGDFLP